jgi:hypothetical protein
VAEVSPLLWPPRHIPALATSLATNGGFALPLPLGAGLLVEATLAKLRIQSRALNFSLEPAQGAIETFVISDDDFQDYHTPSFRTQL